MKYIFIMLLFISQSFAIDILAIYSEETKKYQLIQPKENKELQKKIELVKKKLKKPKTYEDVILNLSILQSLSNETKYIIKEEKGKEYIFKREEVNNDRFTITSKIKIEEDIKEYKPFLNSELKDRIMCKGLFFYFMMTKGKMIYEIEYLNNKNIVMMKDVYHIRKCENLLNKELAMKN